MTYQLVYWEHVHVCFGFNDTCNLAIINHEIIKLVYIRVYFWQKEKYGYRETRPMQIVNGGVCGLHVIHLYIKSGIIMYNTNVYNVKHIP